MRWLLAAAVSAVVVLPSLLCGPNIQPDSVRHYAAAEHLLGGRGLLDFDGQPLRSRPPLYSIALAVPLAFGATRDNAAVVVNFCAVLAVFLLTAAILDHAKTRLRYLWAAVVATSTGLLPWANSALTEPMALALLLGMILAFLQSQTKPRMLWIASGLGVLLCLTRYAGLAAVIGVAVGGLSARRGLMLALPSAATVAGFYLWAGNADHRVATEPSRLVPSLRDALSGGIVTFGGILGLVLLVCGAAWVAFRRKSGPATVLFVGAAVYTVAVTVVNVFVNLGGMDSRMILPAVAMVLLAFAVGQDANWRRVVAVGLLAGNLVSGYAIWQQSKDTSGLGFNCESWKTSKLIAWIRDTPGADTLVASNSPAAVWWLTGKVTRRLPFVDDGALSESKMVRPGLNCLIWWRQYLPNTRFYTPRAVDSAFPQNQAVEFPEAVVIQTIRP